MRDVMVIGGGISGLTAAWRLNRMGLDVELAEADSSPGGNLKTLVSDGYRMESGPHSFMGSSEFTWKLIREMSFHHAVEPASPVSNNRYIYRDNRLHALPLGALAFIRTKLLSLPAKIRLGMEPFMPGGAKPYDTAWDFFIRRFGEEAATFIMGPFISGVYAGNPKQLGARASFPKFWNFENDWGSMIIGAYFYMRAKKKRLAREGEAIRKGLYSFKGGLGRLTEHLADALGDAVRCGVTVTALDCLDDGTWRVRGDAGYEVTARSVVLAVPPHRLVPLVRDVIPESVEPLEKIPMSPVIVAHWAYPSAEKRVPPGFGFLMPRIYQWHVLGTLFPSHLFRNRAPEGQDLLVSFYGGMLDPETLNLDDAAFARLVEREHESILGANRERGRLLKILRYPHAIPQLLPDHPDRMAAVSRAVTRCSGVFLAGNYLTGVGMEHAVHSGFTASEACHAFLRGEAGSAVSQTHTIGIPDPARAAQDPGGDGNAAAGSRSEEPAPASAAAAAPRTTGRGDPPV